MRWILCVIALFLFLAWDIAENDGQFTRMITDSIHALEREINLR
jgi:hypothetical protein